MRHETCWTPRWRRGPRWTRSVWPTPRARGCCCGPAWRSYQPEMHFVNFASLVDSRPPPPWPPASWSRRMSRAERCGSQGRDTESWRQWSSRTWRPGTRRQAETSSTRLGTQLICEDLQVLLKQQTEQYNAMQHQASIYLHSPSKVPRWKHPKNSRSPNPLMCLK